MLLHGDTFEAVPDRREVGGKAANLVALRRMGLRVPEFWVVPRSVFDQARVAGVPACAWPTPPALAEAIHALPAGRLFAVRSSAVDEDSARHSFAGVLESVLNVPRGQVAAAIRRVWASALSERACLYRKRKGLRAGEAATAVIVQAMVQPSCAGVLFTRDPADGTRCMVITAGFGLGEGVVSGAVESDTYRIGWDGDVIAADVPVKGTRIVLADAVAGGTRQERLRRSAGKRPVLSVRQVRALRDLGRDLERAVGSPQDVEWAYDAHGRLVVLQARPIVAGSLASRGPRRVWDNANVVESYPGLTLPLTFTFARRAYRRTFARVARSFSPLGGQAPPAAVYDGLIGLLGGRVYYNLLAWYEMFAHLPGAEGYRASWDRLIGVGPGGAAASRTTAPARGLFARAGTLLACLAVLLRVGSLRRRFFGAFDAFLARHADAGHEATPDEALERFAAIEEEAAGFWHLTIQNDFCALKYHAWLAGLLERWGRERGAAVLGALVSGPESVQSVAPVRSLLALTDAVRADAGSRVLFANDDDAAVWAALQAEPRWSGLRAAFEAHRRAFGDRSVAELKLDTVTFAEDPARLVGLVRRYLRTGQSAADVDRRRAAAVARAAALARDAVPGLVRGAAFRFVLGRAREAIRSREDMRLARTRLFGVVRRLFRRLGQALHEQGVLAAPADVHYLTVEELFDLVRGTGVTRDVAGLVALRRRDYAVHAAARPPGRLETFGLPVATGVAEHHPDGTRGASLRGTGCAAGQASGPASVVDDPERAAGGPDRVLVAATTDPGWVFLMMSSAGIVVERGSLLSHTAIIGRELGIPTVVGAAGATRLIPDGARVTIDGGTGDVRWA